ncbi:MAG TPA: fibronectin type III domain-containing protein [Candidatus Thermoplasmatota archaeon]|nr:fibronectin type III domain-containing protein [Candidatus Thermoplasmatota archaeon]
MAASVSISGTAQATPANAESRLLSSSFRDVVLAGAIVFFAALLLPGILAQEAEAQTQTPLQTASAGWSVSTCCGGWGSMGYQFTPTTNGQVLGLGAKAPAVAQTVRLWRVSDGALLASASVTTTGTNNWVYTSISAVTLVAGQSYIVSTAIPCCTSYGYIPSFSTPRTEGAITIQASRYGDSFPQNSWTGEMYGLADIQFSTVQPPSAPRNLTATGGNGQITLNWQAPQNGTSITNYKVFVSDANGGPYSLLATVGNVLTYTHTGLGQLVTKYYVVSAVNATGEGPQSNQASARTFGPPSAPQNLQRAEGDAFISLSWQAPADNGGGAVSNYRVYRQVDCAGGFSLLASPTATSYNDTGLTNGRSYCYRVSAVNTYGEGPQTGTVSGIPYTTPGAPQSFVATRGDQSVALSWSYPANDGGRGVQYYMIHRGTSCGSKSLLTTVAIASYTDTGLTNGVTYCYAISAVNAAGEGARTADVQATPARAPSAPRNLAAVAGDGNVSLSWDEPTDNGGLAVQSYQIHRGTSCGSETFFGSVPASQRTYLNTGLANGQTYCYNVRAVNEVGAGAASGSASAKPLARPAPPEFAAAATAQRQVTLTWTLSPPPDSATAATSDYRVLRGSDPNELSVLATVGPNTNRHVDNGVPAGLWFYSVRAVGSTGDGANAPAQSVTVSPGPPSAPRNLVAVRGNQSATLSWLAPADNGGLPVTAYNVHRSQGCGATAPKVHVGSTGGLNFTDTGLTNGQAYCYNVTAVNSATPVREGPASNDASVVPATEPEAPRNFAASTGNGRVTLTWQAPAGNGGDAITGYAVFRATGSSCASASQIASLGASNTSFTNGGLTNGQQYCFALRAVNTAGSSAAATVAATPGAEPPALPQSLAATRGNQQVALTWNAPSTDGGSAILRYQVYRGTSCDSKSFAGNATATNFTDGGLANGVTYCYHVTAVNAVGEGAASANVQAKPATVPGVPTGLAATAGHTQASLSWNAPSSNGGEPITSYRVYRGTTCASRSFLANASGTTYQDTGLTNGQEYCYAVSAVNVVNEGAQSSVATVVPHTVATAPQAAHAAHGTGRVTLSWQVPSSNGGWPLSEYRVYRSAAGGPFQRIATVAAGTLSYADTDVVNQASVGLPNAAGVVGGAVTAGVEYCYRVTAFNDAEGPASATVCDTPGPQPSAPRSLGVVALSGGQARLCWTPPQYNGDGGALTKYTVYRGHASGGALFRIDLPASTNVAACGGPGFVDGGLQSGLRYVYYVAASNAAGESARSNEAGVP